MKCSKQPKKQNKPNFYFSQMCAVGGWGPMFGTKSQKKTFFFTPSLNKPCVLFVIFIWPQECSTTSKLHSSLPNLETGCSSPSLAAAIFSLALLNASSTEFTLGKRVTELMMMMEAVGIKVVIMGSVMMVKVCHLEKRVAELSRSIKNFRLSRLLVTLPPTKKAFA